MAYGKLPLSGSIVINIPKKVLKLDKNDKIILQNTLTKLGGVSGRYTKTINLKPVTGNKVSIVSQGILRESDKKSRERLSDRINEEINLYNILGNARKNKKK